MRDQAAELRNLVLRSSRQARISAGPPPKLVWLVGARQEVGCTTLARGISETLADQGFRIVLIQTNATDEKPSLTTEPNDSKDWVRERLEIHEVIQNVKPGLQYVASLGTSELEGFRPEHRSWLYRQLCTLGPHADLVIVDGSHRDESVNKAMCEIVDLVTVITTPSPRSIVDGYLKFKKFQSLQTKARPSLMVNRAETVAEAKRVWERVSISCQRFLEFEVDSIGYLPNCESLHQNSMRIGEFELDDSSELFGLFRSMGTTLVAVANQPWANNNAA